jgi:predicted DsbA family dithiol-disulfide isomerase
MHSLLFERQEALQTKDLIRYAGELGLDAERFRNELKHQTYRDKVRADFIAGVQNGVYGTRSFPECARYDGDWDRETLLTLLNLLKP